MTHDTAPSSISSAADKLDVRQRSRIWRVSLNGAFYGDYGRREWAIAAAVEKAEEIARRGGGATVTLSADGDKDALLLAMRQPGSDPRR